MSTERDDTDGSIRQVKAADEIISVDRGNRSKQPIRIRRHLDPEAPAQRIDISSARHERLSLRDKAIALRGERSA